VTKATAESQSPARKRKGHGRRRKPADRRRRPEVIDMSDAEKVCGCGGTAKVRIGQTTNERLDYQPMTLFVRELIRPVYACNSCQFQGHDPRAGLETAPPVLVFDPPDEARCRSTLVKSCPVSVTELPAASVEAVLLLKIYAASTRPVGGAPFALES